MIPDNASYREKYDLAMQVTTEEEAKAYFAVCVDHTMRLDPTLTREQAEFIERESIAQWSQDGGRAVMEHVRRLYGFGHPSLDDPRSAMERARDRMMDLTRMQAKWKSESRKREGQ
jgi:hypothetical protein